MAEVQDGLTIDAWIKGLEGLPEEGFVAAVNAYLAEHPVDAASCQPYLFFDEHHYTRNLIFKNDQFEVLALCWNPGNESAIHNHRDQECWMVMVSGCLEIVNYRAVEQDPARGFCRLEPTSTARLTRENPVGIDQDEPIHKVVNCPHAAERAVSLHIYSKPFETCEIYAFEAQTYQDVKLSYWSEYGKLVGGEPSGAS
jgi:cysteine dioxygenase